MRDEVDSQDIGLASQDPLSPILSQNQPVGESHEQNLTTVSRLRHMISQMENEIRMSGDSSESRIHGDPLPI